MTTLTFQQTRDLPSPATEALIHLESRGVFLANPHDDRGNAGFMHRGDPFDKRGIIDLPKTFIMHDHIVAFRPIGLLIDAYAVLARIAPFVDDRPFDVGARADPFAENALLFFIIVTAPSSNEQRTKRFWRIRCERGGSEKDEREKDF